MSLEYYQLLAILFVLAEAQTQLISPCPDLFQYEPLNPKEPDRWYGTVTLLSETDLNGVWLRLIFDKPPIQLGNWLGEVRTSDNTSFLVKNPMHKVAKNMPYKVRFYVRYNPKNVPPMLTSFRLNAKTKCPLKEDATPPPAVPVNGNDSTDEPPSSPPARPPSKEEEDIHLADILVHKPSRLGVDPDTSACGTVVPLPRPLIAYGQTTQEAEFPWHAALYHVNGIDLTYVCGASLITRYHLITLARCVTQKKSPKPLSPDNLLVYLGKFHLRQLSNPGIQDRQVDLITLHPSYNAESVSNDIAIIKLALPAEITNYVRPVCLWEDDQELQTIIDKAGTVVGWGLDETGKVTDQLTKAEMPVVSQETCIYSFPEFYSKYTSANTFCAGFRNGTSVCNGDSGGGMVFPKASMTGQGRPIWQLRGLASISVQLPNQPICDASHYVVFTDVAKYLDWIKSTLI